MNTNEQQTMHDEMKKPGGRFVLKTDKGVIKLEKVALFTEDETGQKHTVISEWILFIHGEDKNQRRPNEIHGAAQVFISDDDMLAIAEHVIKHSKDTQQQHTHEQQTR